MNLCVLPGFEQNLRSMPKFWLHATVGGCYQLTNAEFEASQLDDLRHLSTVLPSHSCDFDLCAWILKEIIKYCTLRKMAAN